MTILRTSHNDIFDSYRDYGSIRIVRVGNDDDPAMKIDLDLKQVTINVEHRLVRELPSKLLNLVLYHETNHLFVSPRSTRVVKEDMMELIEYIHDPKKAKVFLGIVYNYDVDRYGKLTKPDYVDLLNYSADIFEEKQEDDKWKDLNQALYREPNNEASQQIRDILEERTSSSERARKLYEYFEEKNENREEDKEEDNEQNGETGNGGTGKGDSGEIGKEKKEEEEEDADEVPAELINPVPGDSEESDEIESEELEGTKTILDELLDEDTATRVAGYISGRVRDPVQEEIVLAKIAHVLHLFHSGFSLVGKFRTEETGNGFFIGTRSVESVSDLTRLASPRDIALMDVLPLQTLRARKLGVSHHGTGLERAVIYQDVSGSIMTGGTDEHGMHEAQKEIVGVTCGLVTEIVKNKGMVAHGIFDGEVHSFIPMTNKYLSVFTNTMRWTGGGTSFADVLTHAQRYFEQEDIIIVTDGISELTERTTRPFLSTRNRVIFAIAGEYQSADLSNLHDFAVSTGGGMIVYNSSDQNCHVVDKIGDILQNKKV